MRGAIIAGGDATRFGGQPKGLARVGSERILDRLARVLTDALGEPPLLVANAPDAATWHPDLRVIPDVQPRCGSLGGIYTAIVHAPAPVICVAWDMPFITETLVRTLAERLANYDVVVPESQGPRSVEPLCAAYGPGAEAAIAANLAAGDLRAVGFHDRVKVDILSLKEVAAIAAPDFLFFNVNTADDLARAEALWRRHESFR